MKNTESLKNAIRNPFAWPGGYPVYVILDDGEMLCHKCVKENYRQLLHSTRNHAKDGWEVIGAEVLWENEDALVCAHCSSVLEPAYDKE